MATNDTTPPAHTPGPWHIDLDSPYSAICIKPYPGEIVCDIEGADAQAEANARLIAAAPELLRTVRSDRVAFEERIEVLEEEKLELGVSDEEFADQDIIDNYRHLVDRCDEVIARATVGAPDDPLRAARSREQATDDHTPAATTTHPCPHCGKPVEARNDEPAWKSCEPCDIAEATSWAFGRILVRRYPQAVSGDLSPGATFDMDRAVAAAAREWIDNNVLLEDTDGSQA